MEKLCQCIKSIGATGVCVFLIQKLKGTRVESTPSFLGLTRKEATSMLVGSIGTEDVLGSLWTDRQIG